MENSASVLNQMDVLDYQADLDDLFCMDFNDGREQETERFYAQFASILRSTVLASGFARA